MIKLIALDLDGTLYNSARLITPKTSAALLAAQQQGIRVVIASGRPLPGLFKAAAELQLANYGGYIIAYNGAKAVDCANNQEIYKNCIPETTARSLLQHLQQYPVTPIVDDGSYIYTDNADGFQIQHESSGGGLLIRVVDSIVDAVVFDPAKILIASPNEQLLPAIEGISQPFYSALSFVMSTPFYLEATVKGVDKANALGALCRQLGISGAEVLAFGDAENDRTMLEFAGMGIAMANACDTLKTIANAVTLSNNEDGIACSLAEFVGV